MINRFFYILPVVEFFQNGILERDITFGSLEYNPITLLSAFSPYIIGPIHAYWTTNLEHISLFGYSGLFALFFSLIDIFFLSFLSTKLLIFFIFIFSGKVKSFFNSVFLIPTKYKRSLDCGIP